MNWQITKLTGAKQQIRDALSANKEIPKHWQDAINSDVEAMNPAPGAIVVAAFSNDCDGRNGSVRNIQITIRY